MRRLDSRPSKPSLQGGVSVLALVPTLAGAAGVLLGPEFLCLDADAPSAGHLLGLGMELLVVPALVVWQARLAPAGFAATWHGIVRRFVASQSAPDPGVNASLGLTHG